jgi:RNA polymerase sigma-70 factor (ECF subfamily)
MDEKHLVTAARRGELAAFNQLVLCYQSVAYNVAFRIMGDAEAAADATQDAFLKAYRALDSFRGESFKAWLLRIVTNTCYDQLRARQRRPSSGLEDLVEDVEHTWRLAETGESPDEYAERVELNRVLQWALTQLPPDQRTVVVLSDIEGLSYEEIATVMNIRLGTVKSRLSRARARLRDLLQQHQELLPARYRLSNETLS